MHAAAPFLALLFAFAPGDDDDPSAPQLSPEQVQARSLAQTALSSYGRKEWKKALDAAAQAEKLDGRYALPVRIEGWCAIALQDDAKAAERLTQALNLEPADLETELLLARCHLRLEEWGAAKDLLSDLMKKQGVSVELLSPMAECCVGEGDLDGALQILTRARELAPKERSLTEQLISLREARGEWLLAAGEIRPILAASPGDKPLRWRLIQCFLELRDWPTAIAELEEACRTWKDDPAPHRTLVGLYREVVPDAAKLAAEEEWLKAWNVRRR